jgi:micrococcal nuclease
MELENQTDATEMFSLKGIITLAKVVEVIDGDTVKIVFKYNGNFYRWSCRLNNINTPELKSTDPRIKEIAYKAKSFVIEHLLNKIVEVRCYIFDSFGRIIIDIFIAGKLFNEILLQEGLACPYKDRATFKW